MKKVYQSKLTFWQNHEKNCLFLGRHGVGKTAIIREVLEKLGLKFGESIAYYSNFDHVFIGDPTTAKLILFDDLNDSQAQAAAKDVSGLKVWNGKPVTAHVWGVFAYEVDPADPHMVIDVPESVKSAFEVVVEIPFQPNEEWFVDRYGQKVAHAALEWWADLEISTQNDISPKRLADALEMFNKRGDIRDVLPVTSNVAKLVVAITSGPVADRLEELMKNHDDNAARKFFENENLYAASMKYIIKSETLMNYFLPLLPENKLLFWFVENNSVRKFVRRKVLETPFYQELYFKILAAGADSGPHAKASKHIRKQLCDSAELAAKFHELNAARNNDG